MGRLAKTMPFVQMMFKLQKKKGQNAWNDLKNNLKRKSSNFIEMDIHGALHSA